MSQKFFVDESGTAGANSSFKSGQASAAAASSFKSG